ncbi:LysR substrate-binding domain-containing protein [Aquisalimonas asiatica]|uniref:Transcriptional regulator, LysR family n=1 Tax=Aquisalimonas asiatica TaxID=406100 RepID=A0A1H8UAL9_9GAMM|nr:LysR substrate-binding domain-containing protein [Aquisalimonas asiatica]SEP00279.1 transcriptional regulator, LysR family [Aquisalimonas asiatica]
MNLRDLRYLVAVADHRHFGRAAEACHVSQPTLSAQLKKLEQFLGVQLVERSSKQIMLTAIGDDVARRARGMLNLADDIVEVARAASDPFAGDLRLGIIPTVAPYLLPYLAPAFERELPRLRPLLREEQTAACLEKLRNGAIDVAVIAVPFEGADAFAQVALYDEPFVLAAPAGHPLAERSAITLEDLADERVLLLEEGHCLRDQALSVCQTVGAREAREFRATSLETLRQMAAAGAGITLLPQMAALADANPMGNGRLLLRRFSAPEPRRQVAILWRKGSAREPTVRAIADVIRGLPEVRALWER